MKKIIFLIILCCCTIIMVKAQRTDRFTYATSIGTGLAMSEPANTPFTWQVLGYYNMSKRLSIGAGTGLSIYEKALIPLFADAKYSIVKSGRMIPYLECGVGYSFAPDKNANGGFYMNPSIGVQYSICENKKIFFALGYELQEFERLKAQEKPLFTAEFSERLSHSSVSAKVGFVF